jgi:RIO kinase 1
VTRISVSDILDGEIDLELDRSTFRPRTQAQAEARLHRAGRHDEGRFTDHAVIDEILAHAEEPIVEGAFNPTFSSSRYERVWILNYLGPFYDKKQITDVLRKVKGGKEANVYCCAGGPAVGLDLVAAKVYRPRQFRNLRNDSLYRQGREIMGARGAPVRDRRALHAIRVGTRKGKEMEHVSWLAHEYVTLQVLHAAGVRVPRPLAFANNTVLMEYVGGLATPAPTLQSVKLPRTEARGLFDALLHDVELMLSAGRIHADLSAFNVLYAGGDYRIIDFPQAVDPALHPSAFPLFQRDVTRLCQYFARYGIAADAPALAADIWYRVSAVSRFPSKTL